MKDVPLPRELAARRPSFRALLEFAHVVPRGIRLRDNVVEGGLQEFCPRVVEMLLVDGGADPDLFSCL